MNNQTLKLIAEIDEFKGFWKGINISDQDMLSRFRIVATIESIGSSTRIEGAMLTDREVENLLEGLNTNSFQNRDEQEVAGYADAMRQIYSSHSEINFSENNIKYLHKILMNYSIKDQWHMGNYKKHPNHVAVFKNGKQTQIIFETASPFETPHKMNELINDYQKKLKKEHPLIVISDFVLHFLAIHPFQDGNGRLSRILTNLLLIKYGYDYVQYSSHERIIEANKKQYYISLRKSQHALKESQSDLTWTEFFLEVLKKQKDSLLEKIQREKLANTLPGLSLKIMDIAKQHGRVNISFLEKTLQENRNTIKKHIQQLCKQNLLILHGKGRGVYYTL
ncbi:MAG: Fic family protein [Candidatus Magnetomorum sp.]|nr:Fic family protein [Candidatus Magnetomorum sp.]